MSWALPKDIEAIRDAILTAEAIEDFYIRMPNSELIGGRPEHAVILSVYGANVPSEIFGLIRRNIEIGNSIIREGYVGITTKDNLVDGKDKLAHSISPLLAKIWGVEIMHPGGEDITRQIRIEKIGSIRSDFRDYEKEFQYSTKVFRI